MNTPKTDKLSTFLVTQFPSTLGNWELHKLLSEFEQLERELNEAKEEIKWLKREADLLGGNLVQWKQMAQELAAYIMEQRSHAGMETIPKIIVRFNLLNK